MKKFYLLFFLMSLSATGMQADPVTKETALKSAQSFLTKHKSKGNANLSLVYRSVRSHASKGRGVAAKDAYYYIFNNEDGGFVIVSGDDATDEILGYSDTGKLNVNNIPEGMQELLDGYQAEITYARNNGMRKANSANNDTEISKQVIEPLIETSWGQDNPYNQQCFTTSGAQAVTGCVATAMAQVMYYHKWPRESTTEIPAYSSYEALPATTFDWDNMLLGYTSNETTEDVNAIAVAKLMHYCGQSVQMSYGTSGSAASNEDCIKAFTEYFGYENKPVNIQRNSFSQDEWDNILYNELYHRRPIIFAGNSASGSGHAFICDGFDGYGLYHINWGWEGKSDGYFRLQALNPVSQGTGSGVSNYGFTYRQTALVGISPTLVENEEALSSDVKRVKVESIKLADETNNTYDYSKGCLPNVSVKYSFSVSVAGKYSFAFGLYQGDNLIDNTLSFYTNTISSAYPMSFTSLTIGWLGYNLADGVYQIKCLCHPDGVTEWYKNEDADYKYIEVTIANGKATFVSKEEYPQIDVVDVQQLFEASSREQLRVTLKNNSDFNFSGIQYLMINDTICSRENTYIDAGKESEVDFFFFYSKLAPVNLKIASRTSSNVIYENPNFQFIKQPTTEQPEVLAREIKNLDNTNHKIYGRVIEATFTLRNNTDTDYHGSISLNVERSLGNGRWSILSSSGNADVKAGETKTVSAQYKGLNYGDVVTVYASCAGVSVSGSGSYTLTAGCMEWDKNGKGNGKAFETSNIVSDDVTAISFEGLDITGTTITPNNNPNTIYYFDADATIPASLNGKNVVKGYKAVGDFNLQDGYNYFVPKMFTVDGTANYTRTTTIAGTEQEGWRTILLPFTVSQVKNATDNQEIQWRHCSDNEKKNFWVKEFNQVDDNQICFENIDTWMPNEPYIISVPNELMGKKMVFSATGTKVYPTATCAKVTNDYSFIGTPYDQTLSDIYVMNEMGTAFEPNQEATVEACSAYFTVSKRVSPQPTSIPVFNFLLGDANGDGVVNISDVALIVNYILGTDCPEIVFRNADVIVDNTLNVSDVVGVVNIILGQ